MMISLLSAWILVGGCYSYNGVFDKESDPLAGRIEAAVSEIRSGDYINIVVRGEDHRDLQVLNITNGTRGCRISTLSPYPDYQYSTVSVSEIDRLEVRRPDSTYTLGAGYSTLLLLFFLLA